MNKNLETRNSVPLEQYMAIAVQLVPHGTPLTHEVIKAVYSTYSQIIANPIMNDLYKYIQSDAITLHQAIYPNQPSQELSLQNLLSDIAIYLETQTTNVTEE